MTTSNSIKTFSNSGIYTCPSIFLKLWHRWFFVEHFEVLYSVGSVESNLLHLDNVENRLHEPCNLKMHEARTISKTILRETLGKWCTTRLGNDVFMHYFTTTTASERSASNSNLENKSMEPPPGVPQVRVEYFFKCLFALTTRLYQDYRISRKPI